MRERLKLFIQKLGISQAEVARRIGMTPQALSNYFQERSQEIPFKALEKLRAEFKVNLLWIFNGEGNMLISKEQFEKEQVPEETWKKSIRPKTKPKLQKIFDLITEKKFSKEQLNTLEKIIRSMKKNI